MGIFNLFKKKEKPQERSYTPYGLNSLVYNTNSSYRNDKAMLLSTVYRCVDVISDSVAQLPLELLDGNGYALIERDDKGNATKLKLIPSELVTVSRVDPLKEKIMYNVVGINQLIEPVNMIHILNFSYDGITGISTLQHARNTLGLASDSEAHAEGFFKGGANLAGIIKVQSSLTPKQKLDIKESWQATFSPITGTPNQ